MSKKKKQKLGHWSSAALNPKAAAQAAINAGKAAAIDAADSDDDLETAVANVAPQITEHRKFLNSLVGLGPANLTQGQINKWDDVDLTMPLGRMVNEVAKKYNDRIFNDANGVKLGQLKYNDPKEDGAYGADHLSTTPTVIPTMILKQPPGSDPLKDPKIIGADPRDVGHELIHANDHQLDELNPRIWQRLMRLGAEGVNYSGPKKGHSSPTLANFQAAVTRIKNKIEPSGIFAKNKHYEISGDAIRRLMDETGAYPSIAAPQEYSIPKQGNKINWMKLRSDIHSIIGGAYARPRFQNPGFYFSPGSEFPAYMLERLHEKWNTGDLQKDQAGNQLIDQAGKPLRGPDSLYPHEALFAYGGLKDLEEAYPEQQVPSGGGNPVTAYPEINQNARARRYSILDAYHPDYSKALKAYDPNSANAAPQAPSPEWEWARGGHVTKKNLLSRFIKPKRKAS